MAVFEYKAFDLDDSTVAGTIVADTPRQARDVLRDRGLTVARVQPVRQAGKASFFQKRRGRKAQGQVVAFIRELATLLTAGIPLLPALHTLIRQHRGSIKTAIQHLADQVAEGVSLAEAMGRQGAYFDELSISITRVGESTGSLEQSLRRLAEYKDKTQRLASRVTTALIYPAVVLTIGLAVTVFLMSYVVPNLLSTLAQEGRELPAITRAVKGASDFLRGWWWAILAGLAAATAAARLLLRTDRARRLADRLKLALPVLGELIRKENTSRMAVILAALLRSGLAFVEAVRITRRTLSNRVFQQAMDRYAAAVTAGSDVAAPLESSGVFAPMVVQMLAVGQQSGQLEDMLEHLAQTYDQEVDTATRRLTSLLEPLLIVVLAVLIGCIAVATLLPILEASNVF